MDLLPRYVTNGDSMDISFPKQFSQSTCKLRQRLSNIWWILTIICFSIILVLIGVILWQRFGSAVESNGNDSPAFLPPKKTWIDEEALRNMTILKLNFDADPCEDFVAYACKEEDEPHQSNEDKKRKRRSMDATDEPYWVQAANQVIAKCKNEQEKLETSLKESGKQKEYIDDYFDATFVDLLREDVILNIDEENFAELAAILRRDYGFHFPFKLTSDFSLDLPDSLIPWKVWKNYDDLSPQGQIEILKVGRVKANWTEVQFEREISTFVNSKNSSWFDVEAKNEMFWNWTKYFMTLGANFDQHTEVVDSAEFDLYGLIQYIKNNSDDLKDYLFLAVLKHSPSCDKMFPILSIQKSSEQKAEKYKSKLDFLQNLASFFKHEYIKFASGLLGQLHAKEIETILQNTNIQIGAPDYTDQLNDMFQENLTPAENFWASYFAYNGFLSKIMLNYQNWDLWDKISSIIYSPLAEFPDSTIYYAGTWLDDINLDLPYAMIAGQFLSTLGHELTHVFYRMPQFANLSTIGIDKTIYEYSTSCVKQAYTKKLVENETLELSGTQTFNEDVADLLGLLISFHVYEKYLKPLDYLPPGFPLTLDQLFFAALGRTESMCQGITGYRRLFYQLSDVHSIGWIRLETLLRNVPQFSNVFNCPKTAPMNEELKCAALFGFFDKT